MLSPARRRSRISHFRAPFVVGIASAAVAVVGCGGRTPEESSTNGAPNGGTSNHAGQGTGDAEELAPTLQPLPCTGPAPSPPGSICGCVNGQWLATSPSCAPAPPSVNPPPVTAQRPCPVDMPVAGSDCYVEAQTCGYPGCEGPTSSTATCVGGQWLVLYSFGPVCNPPPPEIPVCPQRPIVGGATCAYEEQQCFNEACDGAELRNGFLCVGGRWSGEVFSCPQASQDAGSAQPDAGLDGGL